MLVIELEFLTEVPTFPLHWTATAANIIFLGRLWRVQNRKHDEHKGSQGLWESVLTRKECAQRCPESDAAGNEVEQIKETAACDNNGMAGGALFVRLLAAAALCRSRRGGVRPAGE
jgi:hypothetical protein